MQEKRYNDAKKEIRSVLLTYQSSITLEEFLKTYRSLLGERLPSRTLGFPTDVQFLQSMPDVVNVCTDSQGKVLLTGIADETSEHIQKLVSRQRKPPAKNSKSNRNAPRQKISHTPLKVETFLPGSQRAEILNLMQLYPDGVTFSAFALAYRRKYNKCLPLIRGFDTLESMISSLPELSIRTVNNDKMICFANKSIDTTNETKQKISASLEVKGSQNENHLHERRSNIHKSGIAEDVLRNFQLLLQKCPEGIVDVHFPLLYEHLTGKNFDVLELGYSSIIELVDALPHVFKRILNPNGDKNWVILPAKTNGSLFSKDGTLASMNAQISASPKVREGIPPDAASPSLQYIQSTIPQNLDLNKFIPIFVSAIVNPGMFWFQLQTEDAMREFENFEKDLSYFYDNHASSKYIMSDADVAIGATCVVCCPDDKQWYRGVIKSIPSIKYVNVLFVDYGSRENIPRTNLRYVRSKYFDSPAYAFKAQLAGLKPPKNASKWDVKAQQRFIQLCECAILMAYLNSADNDTFSAYLCDTSGDSDIHLNDILIKEGLAELCSENQNGVDIKCLPNKYEEPFSNGVSSESENYLSSESLDQDRPITNSNQINSVPEPDMLNAKRKLIFSPYKPPEAVESNNSADEKDQDSRRYVKQVQLCEDCKIHVINLENKLFMTSGDLSRLLWKDKDSSFLTERLKYKEIGVPFLKLSKEDNINLFKQCIWYKIPEYEKLELRDSSLTLYPLDCAFQVLNIFGHPSVCIRLAIKNEIRSFDPLDPIWKEFNFDYMTDLSDIEKEIEEQLRKLCLYDLKAKNEALKIKRIKLQRLQSNSSMEEIEKIDKLLNVISRRMKQIEMICSQYSSCS